MAVKDVTQKNIEENSAASAFELEELNKKQALETELTDAIAEESVKQTNILEKAFGLQEDEARAAKEAAAKAKRGGGDAGGSLGSSPGGKGKGIFGLLGSMFKVLGGGFLKILGPIWKVLKIMFKGFGLIAGGVALLAGLAFFSKDAKGQEEMINDVIDFFKKIGTALQRFGSIFSGSFMEGMDDVVNEAGEVEKEGLGTKFKKFGEAWGKVTKQISEISIGEYKGLDGVARFMGDMLNKVAGWLVDVGTGIAELITNPQETLAKLQVKIESFFMGIADMLGRVFDKFFNMEFILSMLPQEYVPDSLQESVSKARVKEKQKRIEQLNKDDINTQNRLDSAQKQLEAEQSLGKKANATNLRNLTLSIERAKMDLEANKEQKAYLKEQMLASRENVIQERLNQRIKQITGIDNQDELEKIQRQEEIVSNLREKKFKTGGWGDDFEKMSLAHAKDVQKRLEAVTGKAVGAGKYDPTTGIRYADTGITKEMVKTPEFQAMLNELKSQGLVETGFGKEGDEKNVMAKFSFLLGASIEAQEGITKHSAKALEIQTKLDETKAKKLEAVGGEAALLQQVTDQVMAEVIGSKQTGGPITQTGLYRLHANELVMDNQAVHILDSAVKSGIILTNLQRQSGTFGGGSPIIIQDNSTNQSNQSSSGFMIPPPPVIPDDHSGLLTPSGN